MCSRELMSCIKPFLALFEYCVVRIELHGGDAQPASGGGNICGPASLIRHIMSCLALLTWLSKDEAAPTAWERLGFRVSPEWQGQGHEDLLCSTS